ncbi:MAG: AAA family ATPase [Victivallaceae bacterium]|nr:AAA family ATPase [Victivallaceae bacterium]
MAEIPILTIQEGYGKSRDYLMNKPMTVIGRDTECDVIINKSDVSRKHAQIKYHGDSFMIEDLESANGTFINSSPVTEPCTIKHMDVIQIGSNMLVFNDPDNLRVQPGRTPENGEEITSISLLKNVITLLEENIDKVFKGKPDVIRNIIVCLFADGHVLIEDIPGVGKSILAQTLAKSIQANYKRIQFTPDMMPSDITGMSIYDETKSEFRFVPGPIFGNIILADEINRTTPRTQSSLLECMSESVITIDGRQHVLPKPFFVIATQNPDDYHGTYPLPEPQLDRFLMKLSIGYPIAEAEKEILSSQVESHPLNRISYVIKSNDVLRCHALVRKVHISDKIKDYIIAIANATRQHPALLNGCSPRASLALMRVGQSLAAYYGRDFVIPKDIRMMVAPVLAHRLRMKLRNQGEWKSVEAVLNSILEKIPAPGEEEKR